MLYVYDSAVEDAEEAWMPAYQGVSLAFESAVIEQRIAPPVELLSFDLEGEAARVDDLLRLVADDPAYVAVVTAPWLASGRDLISGLLPSVVSLSAGERPRAPEPGEWVRLVPPIERQAAVLGRWVSGAREAGDGVCVMRGTVEDERLAQTLVRAADRDLEVASVVGAGGIEAAGCGVVAWTAGATKAAELLAALGRRRPRFMGGPALRDPAFVQEAGAVADGVEAVCGCVDLSTSLELRSQRFIQLFQSEFGRPPGPGAVEGWDAARLIVRGLTDGGVSPEALSEWLAAQSAFRGLGGRYAFERDGELANAAARTFRYRVEGRRWVPVRGP